MCPTKDYLASLSHRFSLHVLQVNVELLGSSLTVSQALPREKGTFQRGSVERFSIELEPGRELGEVLAIKV